MKKIETFFKDDATIGEKLRHGKMHAISQCLAVASLKQLKRHIIRLASADSNITQEEVYDIEAIMDEDLDALNDIITKLNNDATLDTKRNSVLMDVDFVSIFPKDSDEAGAAAAKAQSEIDRINHAGNLRAQAEGSENENTENVVPPRDGAPLLGRQVLGDISSNTMLFTPEKQRVDMEKNIWSAPAKYVYP